MTNKIKGRAHIYDLGAAEEEIECQVTLDPTPELLNALTMRILNGLKDDISVSMTCVGQGVGPPDFVLSIVFNSQDMPAIECELEETLHELIYNMEPEVLPELTAMLQRAIREVENRAKELAR